MTLRDVFAQGTIDAGLVPFALRVVYRHQSVTINT
jgi:hypothetical protein